MSATSSKLAVLGGSPAHVVKPPKYPELDPAVFDRIGDTLARGPMQGLSKDHPIVRELEQRLAAFHGVEHGLLTSSGHGALHSALVGLELTGGDEILTSPYSWGASVSCILHNNAIPVFVDVLPDTGLLDPQHLEQAYTPRTRAILVPHLYGRPANMTAIMAFAQRHGLAVIEDGSQAHGARHRGVRVGGFGDASGFSINGVKPLATTEGGYMVSKAAEVYWNAIVSCQHAGRSEMAGRATEPGFQERLRPAIDSLVYTYRPNLVSALLALERLPKLDAENAARRRNVDLFKRHLAGVESVQMPDEDPEDECVYHMVTLNFDAGHAGISRDTYLKALQAEGVPAVVYVEQALHRSPRLSPDWDGPRVMWTQTIRSSGTDPTKTELPACELKVSRSIEIPWNYFREDEAQMASMAAAFIKVEERLEDLREREPAAQRS
jgi:dTDP-4-amino-4,6-dideoxygalactose transaminase